MNPNIQALIEDTEQFLKRLPLDIATLSPEMYMLVCKAMKGNENAIMGLVFYYLAHEHAERLNTTAWEEQASLAIRQAAEAIRERTICE